MLAMYLSADHSCTRRYPYFLFYGTTNSQKPMQSFDFWEFAQSLQIDPRSSLSESLLLSLIANLPLLVGGDRHPKAPVLNRLGMRHENQLPFPRLPE